MIFMKIKLPEEARKIVGSEWFEKQQQVLSDLDVLGNNSAKDENWYFLKIQNVCFLPAIGYFTSVEG